MRKVTEEQYMKIKKLLLSGHSEEFIETITKIDAVAGKCAVVDSKHYADRRALKLIKELPAAKKRRVY
ncbi:MAG TPA: hypothetical protein ENH82_10335 [bacterium]|nr:hypothetical protein [bacterium]